MTWTYTNYPLAYWLGGLGLVGIVAGMVLIYAPAHSRLARVPLRVGYGLAVAGTIACLVSLAVAP